MKGLYSSRGATSLSANSFRQIVNSPAAGSDMHDLPGVRNWPEVAMRSSAQSLHSFPMNGDSFHVRGRITNLSDGLIARKREALPSEFPADSDNSIVRKREQLPREFPADSGEAARTTWSAWLSRISDLKGFSTSLPASPSRRTDWNLPQELGGKVLSLTIYG